MDIRQIITDATVAELRVQLDGDDVHQSGTWVEVRGEFRMVGVAEAVIRATLDPRNTELLEEVAKSISPSSHEWRSYLLVASDAISGMRGALLSSLDPLP